MTVRSVVLVCACSCTWIDREEPVACVDEGADWEGDVTLDNVGDVCGDGACRAVRGNVFVEGDETLADLSAFSCITSISGDLRIAGDNRLETLAGLDRLEVVGGMLDTESMFHLRSFEGAGSLVSVGALDLAGAEAGFVGFDSLEAVGGDLQLEGFQSFRGLGRVTVGGDVLISHSSVPSLTDLDRLEFGARLTINGGDIESLSGLEHVEQLTGLFVEDTNRLTSLRGLDSLERVRGDVVIAGNDQLESLRGLGDLSLIQGSLSVGYYFDYYGMTEYSHDVGNPRLVSLDGLDQLETIDEDLTIHANPLLVDVSSLFRLDEVGDDIQITDNSTLTDPAAYALVDRVESIGGTVVVSGN